MFEVATASDLDSALCVRLALVKLKLFLKVIGTHSNVRFDLNSTAKLNNLPRFPRTAVHVALVARGARTVEAATCTLNLKVCAFAALRPKVHGHGYKRILKSHLGWVKLWKSTLSAAPLERERLLPSADLAFERLLWAAVAIAKCLTPEALSGRKSPQRLRKLSANAEFNLKVIPSGGGRGINPPGGFANLFGRDGLVASTNVKTLPTRRRGAAPPASFRTFFPSVGAPGAHKSCWKAEGERTSDPLRPPLRPGIQPGEVNLTWRPPPFHLFGELTNRTHCERASPSVRNGG